MSRKKLTGGNFKLLTMLDNLSNEGVVKGLKVEDIAKKVGYTTNTIYRYLGKLSTLGFIKKEQIRFGSKRGESQIIIKILK